MASWAKGPVTPRNVSSNLQRNGRIARCNRVPRQSSWNASVVARNVAWSRIQNFQCCVASCSENRTQRGNAWLLTSHFSGTLPMWDDTYLSQQEVLDLLLFSLRFRPLLVVDLHVQVPLVGLVAVHQAFLVFRFQPLVLFDSSELRFPLEPTRLLFLLCFLH